MIPPLCSLAPLGSLHFHPPSIRLSNSHPPFFIFFPPASTFFYFLNRLLPFEINFTPLFFCLNLPERSLASSYNAVSILQREPLLMLNHSHKFLIRIIHHRGLHVRARPHRVNTTLEDVYTHKPTRACTLKRTCARTNGGNIHKVSHRHNIAAKHLLSHL